MKVEITEKITLTNKQDCLLDMHTFLNIICVLGSKLYLISKKIVNENSLQASIRLCDKIKDELSDSNKSMINVKRMKEYENTILNDIQDAVNESQDLGKKVDIEKDIELIQSIFRVLDVRVEELLARKKQPGCWKELDSHTLKEDFFDFFKTVEKNSEGKYRIVYNLAEKKKDDYLVWFNITSSSDKVKIPQVFHDVMRDLLANSRKYVLKGGTIHSGLFCNSDHICFIVKDDGIGIPENEIEKVVGFGERGSNALHKKTMGGGFGLTKAFITTCRFSGRMWIKSSLGKGTTIKIIIPFEGERLNYA